MSEQMLQEVQEWTSDYRRSARVDRWHPLARRPRRKLQLTAEQRQAKREADRRSYEKHKHLIAERRRTARRLVVRESIKLHAERREYIAPRIDKEYLALWTLRAKGMTFSEAYQELNRPKGMPVEWRSERPPRSDPRTKELLPPSDPSIYAPPNFGTYEPHGLTIRDS